MVTDGLIHRGASRQQPATTSGARLPSSLVITIPSSLPFFDRDAVLLESNIDQKREKQVGETDLAGQRKWKQKPEARDTEKETASSCRSLEIQKLKAHLKFRGQVGLQICVRGTILTLCDLCLCSTQSSEYPSRYRS